MTATVCEGPGPGSRTDRSMLAGLTAPVAEWEAVDSCPRRLLVAGEWREARSGRMLTVSDPSTGHALCEVPDAGERDALDALTAAAEAVAAWSACAGAGAAPVG